MAVRMPVTLVSLLLASLCSCKKNQLGSGQFDQSAESAASPGAGVELEVQADALAWQVTESAGDRAGDLLDALPEDVLGTAGAILREAKVAPEQALSQLPVETKNALVKRLSGLRKARYFQAPGGRQIPGLLLKRQIDRPAERQPWVVKGHALIDDTTVHLEKVFEPEVEYGADPSGDKAFSLFEWHSRCDLLAAAGDCYMAVHWLAQSLKLGVRSVHVHVLGHIPSGSSLSAGWVSSLMQAFLPNRKNFEALVLAEYVRRLNLWMDMNSFVESEVSIARRPPQYDLLSPTAYTALVRGLLDAQNVTDRDKLPGRIFASVAFHFPGKYADRLLAGLEIRGFWSQASLPLLARRQALLNALQLRFAAGNLPIDRGVFGRWLAALNTVERGPVAFENIARRLAELAHGLTRSEVIGNLERLVPSASQREAAREWLSAMDDASFDAKAGVLLVFHDWGSDPWLAEMPTLLARVQRAQNEAIADLSRLPKHYETVRGFLLGSGLYTAVLASLGLPPMP